VGQCNLNTGGNLNLKPEQAETWTWGVNLTPDFIKGFTASIDYWDIKIDKYIGTVPASSILTGCYTGNAAYCQFIHRDSTGSLDNVTTGSIDNPLQNVDSLHNKGLDFDVGFHRNLDELGLGQGFGAFSLNLIGTYTLSAKTQIVDSLPTYDCVGEYGGNCGVPTPKWRHTFRATWNAPWGQDVTFAWRYIGGVGLDSNDPKQPNYTGNFDAVNANISSYSYFDLTTSYVLWDKYTFRVGVNNLMDKDPPTLSIPNPQSLIGSLPGATVNAFSIYDTLGRQIFMNFNAKF
jgi:outer membrane receptor protein involved in Fe transport